MKCWAHVDYHCEHSGVVRVFHKDKKFGDKYCWSCAFKVIDINLIELVGVCKTPKLCQIHAIVDSLRKQGIAVLRHRRSGANPGMKRYE